MPDDPRMSVEFESMESCQKRFFFAMDTVYDSSKIHHGIQNAPSLERKQVFDFEDGVRMIVSIDLLNDMQILHVSTSFNAVKFKEFIEDSRFDLSAAEELVKQRFAELSGMDREIQFVAMTENGVLHFGTPYVT